MDARASLLWKVCDEASASLLWRVDSVVQTRAHVGIRRLWWADGLTRTLIVARNARTRVHPIDRIRVHISRMWWWADGHARPITVVSATIRSNHGARASIVAVAEPRAAIDWGLHVVAGAGK